jgi:hypothetical protein
MTDKNFIQKMIKHKYVMIDTEGTVIDVFNSGTTASQFIAKKRLCFNDHLLIAPVKLSDLDETIKDPKKLLRLALNTNGNKPKWEIELKERLFGKGGKYEEKESKDKK